MIVETIKSTRVGDAYERIRHPSGLTIYLYPKENSHSTYAVFGTRYGSIDTRFRRSDEGEAVTMPAGIAHFLEHKLFESEDGDAFARYAKTGASANAYTSFDTTCYLFSCTGHVLESLEILLDFVQSPYFTEQTVKKEQGIIGQEIRMYDDDPQWRVMFNMLCGMYEKHPVRTDIAGTVDSISEITPQTLYGCYHTFYNLNNMALCVAGRFDRDAVLALADRMLKPSNPVTVERLFEEEPDDVQQRRVEQQLSVAVPLFELGFKEKAGKERLSEQVLAASEILLELMASDASPLFRRLLDAGLVNETSFGTEFFEGAGYAAWLFSGESRDPDRVAAEIFSEVRRLRREGIDEKAFQRAKKAVYGRNIAALNGAENIGNEIVSLAFAGRELFCYLEAIAEMRLEQVKERLSGLDEAKSTLSVVNPVAAEGEESKGQKE